MDYLERFPGLTPLRGKLQPLQTTVEANPPKELIEVFIVEVQQKGASNALKALDRGLPKEATKQLFHLRKFVKDDDAPEAARVPGRSGSVAARGPSLHLLVCPIDKITKKELDAVVATFPPKLLPLLSPPRKIWVPKHPPTSEAQAEALSFTYWPTTYKRNNPFGPHPTILEQSQEAITETAGSWMALAEETALQSRNIGLGESAGAVIVQNKVDQLPQIIAVAGDARWREIENRTGKGNTMAHAVMRAIAMVASKRRLNRRRSTTSSQIAPTAQDSNQSSETNSSASDRGDRCSEETLATSMCTQPSTEDLENLTLSAGGAVQPIPEATVPFQRSYDDEGDLFLEKPLTAIEETAYASSQLAPDGYLCLDLEIYITHEPCVMCSMALLHSRFARVVFRRQVHTTGALTAHIMANTQDLAPGLGYGLFWRHELNWKMLGWQWVDEKKEQEDGLKVEQGISV